MQSTNNINMINATHCKVQCGNEFRRFLLPTSKYEDLAKQIRTLFGFDSIENLTLKYTDEEGDMVTISSDDELRFAIGLFAGSLLRLTICNSKNHCGGPGAWKRGCKKHWGDGPTERKPWEDKMESKWENRGAQWKQKWGAKLQANPQILQKKIDQFIGKQDNLSKRLQWLEGKAGNNPNPSFPHRIAHIQMKLKKIEMGLAHLRSLQAQGTDNQNIQPTVQQVAVQPSAPAHNEYESYSSSDDDSRKQRKREIWAKKAEIRTLREGVRTGTINRQDAALKIFTLKEEIGKLREAHREKMAACKKQKEAVTLV